MKKIWKLIIILVLLLLLSVGCAYRDMNRVLFATSSSIDIDDDGNIVIYGELFSAKRSSSDAAEEIRMIHRGEGNTIYKGFMTGQTSVELPISYDISKATIITERAARKGLDIVMDGFKRNQKPSLKQYMFICEQPLEDIMATELPDEMFLGFYLESFMVYNSNVAYVEKIRVNEFFNNRNSGSHVNLVPIIKKIQQGGSEKIDIDGAAVIVEDKMVSSLNKEEVAVYKYMTNKLQTGDLTVKNPMESDNNISIAIMKCNTKKDLITLEDADTVVNLSIDLIVSIPEVQGDIIMTNKEIRDKISHEIEEKIEMQCSELFDKYQQMGIDLINIERDMEIKYPNVKFDINHTRMNVNVNVNIEGSGISTNNK